jgi:peptidyl-dipeptidase A
MRLESFALFVAFTVLGTSLLGCGKKNSKAVAPDISKAPTPAEHQAAAQAFLSTYYNELSKLELEQATAYWKAATSGLKEDFDAYAKADLALRLLHHDSNRYAELKQILTYKDTLEPLTARSLEVAQLAFMGNQLPQELIERMVNAASEIEHTFDTFRATLRGKKLSNNDVLEMLAHERNSVKRRALWGALKAVGAEVGAKLTQLAKVRNEAARTLGYANYWEMQIRLQEYDPTTLLDLVASLVQLTDEPFRRMKSQLDKELAQKFKVQPRALMPWHYDDPFFQNVPPTNNVDPDEFFQKMTKEHIVTLGTQFYADIGLTIDDLAKRSDFFERPGKNQHAFCITMDRLGDIRMLLNVKPTAEWMETMLHESGHAAYYKYIDRSLPYNLREAAHIFTTEGVAMLFGALAKDPSWLIENAGASARRVGLLRRALLEQRRRSQLIFARFAMVMLYFEKALYENPDQDLNRLWYDYVERFQLIRRPPNRNAPDWAAKPHFTIAPVYYHNYLVGELFASQLRATLRSLGSNAGNPPELSSKGRKNIGRFLINNVFAPGMSKPWPAFVQNATGTPLAAEAYATELQDDVGQQPGK